VANNSTADCGTGAGFRLAGSGTLTDSACNLRVRLNNRNSATAPFDEAE